jgi:ankyrin repeat protein
MNSKDDDGNTALHHACIRNPAIVKILIDAGATLNDKNKQGYTPLMYAAMYNNHEAIPLFLAAKAGIHETHRRFLGKTALDFSKKNGHKECVELLRNAIASEKKNQKTSRFFVACPSLKKESVVQSFIRKKPTAPPCEEDDMEPGLPRSKMK